MVCMCNSPDFTSEASINTIDLNRRKSVKLFGLTRDVDAGKNVYAVA